MRVLIVSDTHKKHENLITIMEKERPFDRMIHLGDAEGYEDYIAELAGCPLDIVAGNNDFFSELPKEKEIEIGGLKALITMDTTIMFLPVWRISRKRQGEEAWIL